MSEDAPTQLTDAEVADRIAQTNDYVNNIAPNLGRLFGIDLAIEVGRVPEGAGMGTNPETGGVVVDPRFFLERGYKPEQASWAIMHETASHVRTIVKNPNHSAVVRSFENRGGPQRLFNNIFEDIAGNNLIHAVLPRQRQVAEELYRERLFPETDYKGQPRHIQFVEKILRDEMVPVESVIVDPEVDEAIAGLRDYQGQGDLIKYSTAVAKSGHEAMSSEERFRIWTGIIYPVYEKLLEQDREDPRFQQDPNNPQQGQGEPGDPSENQQDGEQGNQGESGEQSSDNKQPGEQSSREGQEQEGEGQNSDSGEPSDQPTEAGKKPSPNQAGESDDQRFGSYYQDYRENRHPEPFTEEDEQKLEQQIREKIEASRQKPTSHERLMDEKVRSETGHSLHEQRRYDAEVIKWQKSIEEMREAFQTVINERVAQRRGLSRRNFAEGAVLDPDRLVQTVIDVRNQVEQPEAFRDYEMRRGQNEAVGKTDYVFVADISSSMRQGGKSQAAAASGVIVLEGLAALQRDIEEAEATHKVELDLDIRTAMYTFGEKAIRTKELSTKVSPKERLDSYQALSNPSDGATRDFLALEDIEKLPDEPDRRRIVIVVSDGGTYDPGGGSTSARTRKSVDRLRGRGWFVYGISIGSDEAEQLYRPTARRVDDPERVPTTVRDFIEATIS